MNELTKRGFTYLEIVFALGVIIVGTLWLFGNSTFLLGDGWYENVGVKIGTLFINNFFALSIAGLCLYCSKTKYNDINSFFQKGVYIAGYCSLLAFIELINLLQPLPREAYYFSALITNTLLIFHLTSLMTNSVYQNLSKRDVLPAFCAAFFFLGIDGLRFFYGYPGSDETFLSLIFLLRIIVLGSFPIVFALFNVLAVIGSKFNKDYGEFDPRLLDFERNHLGLFVFYMQVIAIVASVTVGGYLILLVDNIGTLSKVFPVHMLSFTWLPFLALYLKYQSKVSLQPKQDLLSDTIPLDKSLLQLNMFGPKDQRVDSFSLESRCATFMIDHDPDSQAESGLTKILLEIRIEEIMVAIKVALKNRLLNNRCFSNQIIGTCNPKYSIRPCVDVLSLFCHLYLDVIAVINEKMKTLVQLLPIIDPSHSKNFNGTKLTEAVFHNNWLFHFDYNWIDWQIMYKNSEIDCAFFPNDMDISDKKKIFNCLAKKKDKLDFIWISEGARDRIAMEAPYVSSIIETWPVTYKKGSVSSHSVTTIAYLLKFEKLLPIMAKYYNFDSMGQKRNSYRLGMLSYFNILDARLKQVHSRDLKYDIISKLADFQYQNFYEKQKALKLVIEGYQDALSLCKSDSSRETCRQRYLSVVKKIGYPDQAIYRAHMRKRYLWDYGYIAMICCDPEHERFEEAWIFLATIDPCDLELARLKDLLNLIALVLSFHHIEAFKKVTPKIVESFFNLAYVLSEGIFSGCLKDTINRLGDFLVRMEASIELISFFLDAKLFLEDQIKVSMLLEDDVIEQLRNHIYALYLESDAKSIALFHSLAHRWPISTGGEEAGFEFQGDFDKKAR